MLHKTNVILQTLVLSLLISCSTNKEINENTKTDNNIKTFVEENYTKKSVYITMRDGVKLYTTIYSPKDSSQTYPILFNRTPYRVKPYGENEFKEHLGPSPLFEKEKYIFVYQDVRGKFMSEGEFINVRPLLNDTTNSKEIDESTDAFDTIDWLIKNIENNNGKVGMWGISYPGFYASCALVRAHPALKAVSPQAPIADWFWDDFHHNGAFFLPHFFHFYSVFGLPRPEITKEWPDRPFQIDETCGYDFFLNNVAALQNIDKKYYKNKVQFWKDVQNHPNYDEFWQKRNILPHLKNIKPAVLLVGGQYDAEDLFGSVKTYLTIEKNNPGTKNYFVYGPWIHGGWARTDGTHLGTVNFKNGNITPSDYYLEKIEFPFFQHHLKAKEKPEIAEATVFQTGKNEWKKFDQWPPTEAKQGNLYFRHQKLTFEDYTKADNNSFDEFISNPNQPVPSWEKESLRMTKEYMIDDQRFVKNRDDVLCYESDILKENITLAGNIIAKLFVSTNREDADWIVKIIDIYPENHPDFISPEGDTTKMENYHQLVRSEIFRGRFRNSFKTPEPFIPNKPTALSIELLDFLHTFKKGHRLMVQIHSTWFPLVDRNPQQWFDNIYTQPRNSDFVSATHRLYFSKEYPSRLVVRKL